MGSLNRRETLGFLLTLKAFWGSPIDVVMMNRPAPFSLRRTTGHVTGVPFRDIVVYSQVLNSRKTSSISGGIPWKVIGVVSR